MREISIRGDHITLGQLLKLAGLVSTGGEVKYLLKEATIRVNGDIDNRRGRKLFPGDIVVVEQNEPIHISASEPST
jgi:ribosome-associated protein